MRGVFAALATPLDADGQLDEAGLERLVGRIVAGGADGVSPAGSTGEGAHLSPQQRVELTARVRALLPKEMPVVSGAPIRDVESGERYLADLAGAGASAALISLQAAYPLGDADVGRVYHRLADRAALPIVLYNIPVFTRVVLSPDLVGELARHPNVLGIKDSSGDVAYLQDVIYATETAQFSVLTGTDNLLVASLALGAHGTLAASVNLVPELAVGIYRAYAAGDLGAARGLQQRLTRVVRACGRGAAPAGWKSALALAGVCSDVMVAPASPLQDPERAALAVQLAELEVDGVAR